MILPLDSELEPWVTRDALLQIESSERARADEVARCAVEPWYWLVNYVYTVQKDEFNKGGKPTPCRFPPREHLRIAFDFCFRESKLVIDKSRQLTFSWLLMAYYTWWCQFHRLEDVVCQTKKQEDVDALVDRVKFMVESQRPWMRPKFSKTFCKATFQSTQSKIRGLPGGDGAGDQIRSANPSRYYLDEGAFVGEFEECRTNAEACCQDIKIVSTAGPGEFDDFIHDRLGLITA